jgi:hypothetical protein
MDLILCCISDYIKDPKKILEYPYFSLPEECENISHSKKKIRSYIRCMFRKNRYISDFRVVNIIKTDYNHIGTYQITAKTGKTILITIELVDAKISCNHWHIFLN